ncbi:signal protein [Streptosporangium amethystogenes]|uniref:signal protein n=1 Tax=Streptosporangium amethystogenes TaxID=2002 RepID=UPI00361AC02F
MNELIAGYANYASTEAILQEQQVASRDAESISVTVTVSLSVSVSWSWTWSY